MSADVALRERAADLGRTTLFGSAEWLEALGLVATSPALRTAHAREAVLRAVDDLSRGLLLRPYDAAADVVSAIEDAWRLRAERRRGGGRLAVNGHEYRRRQRARHRRRRR